MSSTIKKIKIVILSLIIIAIGGFAVAMYFYQSKAVNIDKNTYVKVTSEDNPNSLSQLLVTQIGLKHPKVFLYIADKMHLSRWMKKGRYTVTPDMTLIDLVKLFREGKMKTVDVVIAPAISLESFANRCGSKLESDTLDFYTILKDSSFLSTVGFNPQTVYALIMPDKYNLYYHTTADELMVKMKKEYEKFWNDERTSKLERTGLSTLEVSILASIVSKETNKTDEMPMVAGMYINRLKIGMPLQADPTIKFALNEPGLTRIYETHLQVESPYNTYKNKGLPPGPICIPGKKAIDAVLNFSEHAYIFMCAKSDFSGYHDFAENYQKHLKFAAAYRKALDERNIH